MNSSLKGVLKTKTKVVFNINRLDVNRSYESKDFIIGSDVWKIEVDINHFDEDLRQKWFTVALNLLSSSRPVVSANFSAFIIDSEDKRNFCIKGESTNHYKKGDGYALSLIRSQEFLSERERQLLYPDNKLRVGLYIVVYSQDLNVSQIGLDYRKSFNVKDLSDFEIICGQKKFFVSKLILNSRSKTFHTMFLNDKKKVDVMVIDDIEPKVMEEFLKYLYFGDSDHLDFMREQLLRVAVKYQVFDLKNICENLIYIEINSKNAFKLWQIFDDFNCIEMKDKCIEFIVKNYEEIRTKMDNNWKDFIQNKANLLDEILKTMASILKNNNKVEDENSLKQSLKSFTFHYIK